MRILTALLRFASTADLVEKARINILHDSEQEYLKGQVTRLQGTTAGGMIIGNIELHFSELPGTRKGTTGQNRITEDHTLSGEQR